MYTLSLPLSQTHIHTRTRIHTHSLSLTDIYALFTHPLSLSFLGVAVNENALRYVEVYINRYVEINKVSDMWPATLPLEISGKMLRSDLGKIEIT